jgi:hypothetical protein
MTEPDRVYQIMIAYVYNKCGPLMLEIMCSMRSQSLTQFIIILLLEWVPTFTGFPDIPSLL